MAFGTRGYHQTIACIKKQGVLYNTYTTAKSMLTSATAVVGVSDQLPITSPPDFYDGHKWVVVFQGGLSNRVTGPDTFNVQVVLGGVAVYDSGNITLTTTAHTTIPFWGEIHLTLDTSGNGTLAKFRGQGRFTGQMIQQGGTAAADSTTQSCTALYPNTAPALGTGFNSSVPCTWDFFIGQSVSNAGNGFQLWEYEIIDCN